jgi:hypothetical protein
VDGETEHPHAAEVGCVIVQPLRFGDADAELVLGRTRGDLGMATRADMRSTAACRLPSALAIRASACSSSSVSTLI